MTARRVPISTALVLCGAAPVALAQGAEDKGGALLLIPLVPLLGAIVQLFLAALFPRTVKRLAEAFRSHTDATIAWAALTAVLVGIVCGLSAAGGGEGGKCLAALVFGAVFLTALGGAAGFTMILGRLGLRRDGAIAQPTFISVLAGSAIVFVASLVPLLGQLAMFVLLFVSLGAVVRCAIGAPRVELLDDPAPPARMAVAPPTTAPSE